MVQFLLENVKEFVGEKGVEKSVLFWRGLLQAVAGSFTANMLLTCCAPDLRYEDVTLRIAIYNVYAEGGPAQTMLTHPR